MTALGIEYYSALGIEYCSAMLTFYLNSLPLPIQRFDSGVNIAILNY